MERTSSARRKLFPSTICLPGRRRIAFRSLPGIEGAAMDLFTKLFGDFLVFVYHCFDRIVIRGYLTALSRPELVVHFFREIVGVAEVSKEALSQRTADYQNWVEAYARNHAISIEWAEKGVRKEDHVLPWLRSMEQGPTFRISLPKYPAKDPHRRTPAQPFHALLLLCARRGARTDGCAGGFLLPLPDHLLSQRPQLHRAGAEADGDRLPQG